MSDEFQSQIKAWAEKQDDQPALAPAIRRLVELGLTVRTKPKQAPVEHAARAKELAVKAIEKIIDPSASRATSNAGGMPVWPCDGLRPA